MMRFSLFAILSFLSLSHNAEGQHQFHRSFDDIRPDQILATNDGGSLIIGTYQVPLEPYKNFNSIPILLKLSAAGTIEWNRTYHPETEIVFQKVIQTMEGDYIVGGHTAIRQKRGDDRYEGLLMRIDFQGNIIWTKAFTIDSTNTVVDIVEKPDSELLVLSSSGSSFFTVLNCTSDGNFLSTHHVGLDVNSLPNLYSDTCNPSLPPLNFSGSCYEYFIHPLHFALLSDGSMAIAGTYYDAPCMRTEYAFLTLLSTEGVPLWGETIYTQSNPIEIRVVDEDLFVVAFNYPGFYWRCMSGWDYCWEDVQVELPEFFNNSWTSLYQIDGKRRWSKVLMDNDLLLNVSDVLVDASSDLTLISTPTWGDFSQENTVARLDTTGRLLHAVYLPDNVLEELADSPEYDRDEGEGISYCKSCLKYAATSDNGLYFTGYTDPSFAFETADPASCHFFRLDPLFSYNCGKNRVAEITVTDVDVPYQPFTLIPAEGFFRTTTPPKILEKNVHLHDSLYCFNSQELFPEDFPTSTLGISIYLYPNRVRSGSSAQITFQMVSFGSRPTITLTNASSGQEVGQLPPSAISYDQAGGKGSATINTTGFPPGIYLVKVVAGSQEGIAKLSVER
ncbi:MAG: T9SS type A sorting domain-containing protein [Candidatus Kapaibacterium sp.]